MRRRWRESGIGSLYSMQIPPYHFQRVAHDSDPPVGWLLDAGSRHACRRAQLIRMPGQMRAGKEAHLIDRCRARDGRAAAVFATGRSVGHLRAWPSNFEFMD